MIQNKEIEDFMYRLSKDNVNNMIEQKSFMESVDAESKNNIKFLLSNDIQDELNLISERIFNDTNATVWSRDALISKIKDVSRNSSFINFQTVSDDFIVTNLLLGNIFYNDSKGNFILSPHQMKTLNLGECVLNARRKDIKYFIEIDTSEINTLQNTTEEGFEVEYVNSFNNIKQTRIKYMKMFELITNVFKDKWHIMNNYPELKEYLYEIHDEYYVDDLKNFVYNHSSKGRAYSKVVGFYNAGNVITYDGDLIPIIQKINTEDTRPFGDVVFKIMCQKSNANNRFSMYIIISDVKRLKSSAESGDRRYTSSGINCESFNITKLKEIMPDLDYSLSKTKLCTSLLTHVCDYQLAHPKKRYVITPFETMYL
jgi:hypothetical protein